MKKKSLMEQNSRYLIQVPTNWVGSRLDKFIPSQFPLYSRSFFSRLIDDGQLLINGVPATKSGTILKEGDIITVQFPAPRELQVSALEKKNLPIEVLFEHPHFLIVYKPAGLLVHPPSMVSTAATLVDWLLLNYQNINGVGYVDRPGIVHRLDKDTSGILVIPRTNHAHSTFGDFFRERSIGKTYYAIVQGHPDPSGTIELPIGRDPITKTRMSAQPNPTGSRKVRDATTHYEVVEYFDDAALLKVKPVTGRTHQIRVHLSAIGHPIIGDPVYGRKSKHIKRHALHAYSLSFMFEGTPYFYSKEMPEDMNNLIKTLRKNK